MFVFCSRVKMEFGVLIANVELIIEREAKFCPNCDLENGVELLKIDFYCDICFIWINSTNWRFLEEDLFGEIGIGVGLLERLKWCNFS